MTKRVVIHIAKQAGKNGGAYWRLLLDCGHTATAHFHRRLGQGFTPIRSAPRSMTCLLGCQEALPTNELIKLIELETIIAESTEPAPRRPPSSQPGSEGDCWP